MSLRIERYESVNGFEVVEDRGRIGRLRPGIARCKLCGNTFECNLYVLRDIKSCGCYKHEKLGKLGKYINGFEVLDDYGRINGNRRVKARCKVCGEVFDGQVQNIKLYKSCGCLKGKPIDCKYRKTHVRIFRIYKNMIARCYDIKHKSFPNYGKRGITVSNEWKNNADKFCEWAMENGYENTLTLDRINNNGNYEYSNCRWSDRTTQARNTRVNVLNENLVRLIRNEDRTKMTIVQIAKKHGLKRITVSNVIHYKCWKDIV